MGMVYFRDVERCLVSYIIIVSALHLGLAAALNGVLVLSSEVSSVSLTPLTAFTVQNMWISSSIRWISGEA